MSSKIPPTSNDRQAVRGLVNFYSISESNSRGSGRHTWLGGTSYGTPERIKLSFIEGMLTALRFAQGGGDLKALRDALLDGVPLKTIPMAAQDYPGSKELVL